MQNTALEKNKDIIGRIPVRNLWLLMLYASELFRQLGYGEVAIEENPDDIPDLVANLLSHTVEQRLKRNLSFGYQSREEVIGRVRGRIDLLNTERRMLLNRGKVACRFEDLTINTPRNRFVRAALDSVANIVCKPKLSGRCKALSGALKMQGVSGEKPNQSEIRLDRIGRHDSDDRFMVAAAKLAFDLALPTESAGNKSLALPDREIKWVRHLFEKAIGGFYNVVLSPEGWDTKAGKPLDWQIESKTPAIDSILPGMKTDIVLNNNDLGKRIIIDTKFNSILTKGWYREESLRSGYIYQIYAYLRSQEGRGDLMADNASGLILHPSVGDSVNETVVIQGHAIKFATVDLSASAQDMREQLIQIINF